MLQSAHGISAAATQAGIWDSIRSAQTLVEATAHAVLRMLDFTSDRSVMDSRYCQLLKDLDKSKLVFENACMQGIHNWLTNCAIEVIIQVKQQ